MEHEVKSSPALFGAEYQGKYKKGEIQPPSDVRPEAEDPAYYLAWCNWVYGRYCSAYTMVLPGGFMPGLNQGRSLTELRLYGRGQQPIDKYKGLIDVSNIVGPDNQKLGLVNISWDINGVFKKFREIIIDRLMSVNHEPTVIAIDKPSLRKKALAYAKDRLAAMAPSKAVFEQVGMKPDGVNEDIMNMTPQDVDVLNQMGGYKVGVEIAMREASQASLQFSNFDPEIRRQLCEDFVDAGIAATHQVYDPSSGRQMVEYVDPSGLVIPNSEYDDCRDIDYAGFLKMRSISYIRQCSGMSEEEIVKVARSYTGLCGNQMFNINWNNFATTSRANFAQRYTGNTPYDQFQVQVMTLYFVALDAERYIVGYRPEGNRIFDKVSRESTLNARDEKKGKGVEDNIVQYVYKCEWIVGTNIVFNYGVADLVLRDGTPGAMRAKIPVAIYRSNQGSITGSCIPSIDDLQLAVLKKRHAFAVMPPAPNIAIDMSVLEDSIKLGPYELTPVDMMDIYAVKGILYYNSKSEWGTVGEASNKSPISNLPNGAMEYFGALQNEMMAAIDSLRMISGVNELADGTGNPKDVLNGVAAGAEQASNRSISQLYTAMQSHYKSMVSLIVRGYQCAAVYGEKNIHYLPVGSDVVRMIQMYPEYAMNELDISIRPGFDNQSRQMMIQALTSNRDGQKINEDTYLLVLNLIQTGNIERAQFVMAKAVAEKQKQDQASAIEQMKAQSAAQGEQAKVVEQAKQASVAMEGEVVAKQIVLKGQQELDLEKLKHQNRMEELKLQSKSTVGASPSPAVM